MWSQARQVAAGDTVIIWLVSIVLIRPWPYYILNVPF